MGTCGWSDPSLLSCGRFYPQAVRHKAADRLTFYAKHFPCVEVQCAATKCAINTSSHLLRYPLHQIDTSNYAIPTPATVENWVSKAPPGFVFHIKAFGMFTARRAPTNALPWVVKQQLAPSLAARPTISYSDLSTAQVDALWDRFHEALAVLAKKRRLGVVLFQFPASVHPSAANRAYVAECRKRLRPDARMAVAFRARTWFAGADKEHTLGLLRRLGIALVWVDELQHELQPAVFRAKYGPDVSKYPRIRMPIELNVTTVRQCSSVSTRWW